MTDTKRIQMGIETELANLLRELIKGRKQPTVEELARCVSCLDELARIKGAALSVPEIEARHEAMKERLANARTIAYCDHHDADTERFSAIMDARRFIHTHESGDFLDVATLLDALRAKEAECADLRKANQTFISEEWKGRDESRAQLAQAQKEIERLKSGAWLVVRAREQYPIEAWQFSDDEAQARTFFADVSANWTETFLCRIVAGPGKPQASIPLHPLQADLTVIRYQYAELERSAVDLRAQLAQAERDKAAMTAEVERLKQLSMDRFDCATCGKGVSVDEDGCCKVCGRTAAPITGGACNWCDMPFQECPVHTSLADRITIAREELTEKQQALARAKSSGALYDSEEEAVESAQEYLQELLDEQAEERDHGALVPSVGTGVLDGVMVPREGEAFAIRETGVFSPSPSTSLPAGKFMLGDGSVVQGPREGHAGCRNCAGIQPETCAAHRDAKPESVTYSTRQITTDSGGRNITKPGALSKPENPEGT